MESKELAFFGKIAAGVTHELKNVLAIINESNGLMGDLIAMSKAAPFPNRDRFLRSITKIEEQVRRGVEITSRFNRFSHSMDHPAANVDLNEVVALTVSLAQRFARLKNVELIHYASPKPVMLLAHPFRLQMALTKAIEGCIATMTGAGVVVFRVQDVTLPPSLRIECESAPEGTVELKGTVSAFRAWQEFEELAPSMGARIEWIDSGDAFWMVFDKDPDRMLAK